jgi:hypothetical protein
VIGTSYSAKAEYSAKDIVRVLHSSKRFSDVSPIFPEETVRAFEDFLRAAVERVFLNWKKMSTVTTAKETVQAKKPEAVPFVGWPVGVPKDNTAFYRDYRVFVERTLNRYIKPCPSQQIEDVKQHIWMKLIESNTLEKFVQKARFRKLPAKLTATEAVDYLGITWDQWMDLIRQDPKWLQPVEGSLFSASAVFTNDQIRLVEGSGIFTIQDAIPASDMSKVFRGYLNQVIHNHFANYCRTRVRREVKDQVLPADNVRVLGGRVASPLEGDTTPWEESIVDSGSVSPDLCVDLTKACSYEDVDNLVDLNPHLAAQVEQINRAVGSSNQNDVFNLIADGLSLKEAILKVLTTRKHQTREAQAQVG